jgi:hypothetical protein
MRGFPYNRWRDLCTIIIHSESRSNAKRTAEYWPPCPNSPCHGIWRDDEEEAVRKATSVAKEILADMIANGES